MKIDFIEIFNFRNLEHVSIQPGHNINLFYGQNGSGKTSLLEAIYYLGLGRSFRTRHVSRIINHDSSRLSIFCQLSEQMGSPTLPIGIERSKDPSSLVIKIGGKLASSLIEIAQLLPIQLMNADSHLLLTSGPLVRRQYLDWGVFHVEPSFYGYWQRANRILKQRNAGLKRAHRYTDISLWDEELETIAMELNLYRETYVESLTPILQALLKQLLERQDIVLTYQPGWDTKLALKEIHHQAFERDKQLGYTQQGPHRADLQLKIKGVGVQDILSQGQLKLAAYSLRLAQGQFLYDKTQKHCLFLIDDLPSELDPVKRQLVATIIQGMKAQLFITGIEIEALTNLLTTNSKTFHVEHGQVKPS